MPTVTTTVDIDAPRERVWALFEDPHDYVRLAEPTQRMLEVSQVPIAEGATYREYGGIAPFFAESTWTVVEYRPPEFQRHVGHEDTMDYDLTIRLDDLGDGRCRVTQATTMQPRWFLRPVVAVLWPLLLRRRAEAAMQGTARNYKEAAEAAA